MKTIFVYGILQKDIDAKHFGIKDESYLGRATLYGYTRHGLCEIQKSSKKGDYVCGDVFNVDDELETRLYNFENGFGYERRTVKPHLIDNGKKLDAIAYIYQGLT